MTKRFRPVSRLAAATVTLGLLLSCTTTNNSQPENEGTSSPPAGSERPTVADDVQSLLTALATEVPVTERSVNGTFPGLSRHRLRRFDAEGPLYVYEFPTASALNDFRDGVSPDGSKIPTPDGDGMIIIEWTSPPRMYGDGRVLALYFGASKATRGALSRLLGQQFAPTSNVA